MRMIMYSAYTGALRITEVDVLCVKGGHYYTDEGNGIEKHGVCSEYGTTALFATHAEAVRFLRDDIAENVEDALSKWRASLSTARSNEAAVKKLEEDYHDRNNIPSEADLERLKGLK